MPYTHLERTKSPLGLWQQEILLRSVVLKFYIRLMHRFIEPHYRIGFHFNANIPKKAVAIVMRVTILTWIPSGERCLTVFASRKAERSGEKCHSIQSSAAWNSLWDAKASNRKTGMQFKVLSEFSKLTPQPFYAPRWKAKLVIHLLFSNSLAKSRGKPGFPRIEQWQTQRRKNFFARLQNDTFPF